MGESWPGCLSEKPRQWRETRQCVERQVSGPLSRNCQWGHQQRITAPAHVAILSVGCCRQVERELARHGGEEPGLGTGAQLSLVCSLITDGPPGSSSSWCPWAGELSHLPDSQMPKYGASGQQHHPHTPLTPHFGLSSSDSRQL